MFTTNAPTFNGFTINTGNGKYHCDLNILHQYDIRFQYILSRHCRVLQKRLDLHYPQDGSISPSPEHIYRAMENLRRELTRNNPPPKEGKKRSPGRKEPASHQVDPFLLWVKERADGNPHPHYHLVIWVNANAIRQGWTIFEKAIRQWANALSLPDAPGLVNNCNQSGPDSILIDKNSPTFVEQVNKAYYQGSYLAKTKDKERRVMGEWGFGGTRVPLWVDGRPLDGICL